MENQDIYYCDYPFTSSRQISQRQTAFESTFDKERVQLIYSPNSISNSNNNNNSNSNILPLTIDSTPSSDTIEEFIRKYFPHVEIRKTPLQIEYDNQKAKLNSTWPLPPIETFQTKRKNDLTQFSNLAHGYYSEANNDTNNNNSRNLPITKESIVAIKEGPLETSAGSNSNLYTFLTSKGNLYQSSVVSPDTNNNKDTIPSEEEDEEETATTREGDRERERDSKGENDSFPKNANTNNENIATPLLIFGKVLTYHQRKAPVIR